MRQGRNHGCRLGLSSASLKILAVALMLIDHIAAVLLMGQEVYWPLRTVGRLSFPIFCFLISEGIYYTRSLPRYLGRLALFALISELPYDLAFHGTWYYPHSQNIFFTLTLAVLGAMAVQWARKDIGRRILAAVLVCLLCIFLGDVLETDYGSEGVCLILLFFLLRNSKWPCLVSVAAYMVWCWHGEVQLYALLALPILALYNGSKGAALPKYFFYSFYPLHLLILYGCTFFLA